MYEVHVVPLRRVVAITTQIQALRISDYDAWFRQVRSTLQAQGSIPAAGRALGVGRRTIFTWVAEHPALRRGLDLPERPQILERARAARGTSATRERAARPTRAHVEPFVPEGTEPRAPRVTNGHAKPNGKANGHAKANGKSNGHTNGRGNGHTNGNGNGGAAAAPWTFHGKTGAKNGNGR